MDIWVHMTVSFMSPCFTQVGWHYGPEGRQRGSTSKGTKGHSQEGCGCWGPILPSRLFSLGKTPMLHRGHCPEDHLSRCAEVWQARTISRGCAIAAHGLLPLRIKSQSVCLLPMLGLFGHPCQLRVEMCPPHSWLLFMFPSGQRQFANLSVIHFAASIAALPCLPPRVCMQIRPKLTPFLNSASLAWGNISFMMAQNQLQSFASSSTDLTFFSVCKKEKRTCSSSYMLLL